MFMQSSHTQGNGYHWLCNPWKLPIRYKGDHLIFWFVKEVLPGRFAQAKCCLKLIWVQGKGILHKWRIVKNLTSSDRRVLSLPIQLWSAVTRNLHAYHLHTTTRLRRTFEHELINELYGVQNQVPDFEKTPFPCQYWNWIEKSSWTVLDPRSRWELRTASKDVWKGWEWELKGWEVWVDCGSAGGLLLL